MLHLTGRRKHGLQEDNPKRSKEPEMRREEDNSQVQQSSLIENHGEERTSSWEGYVLIPCPKRRAKIRAFMQRVYEEYSIKAPRPKHLHVLIRLNALNAVTLNAIAIGFAVDGLCHDDTISPFSMEGPGLPNTPDSHQVLSCPRSLHPTALQRAVPHHPWIDLFPFPKMRDNILQGIAAGFLDEDELCHDLLEVEEANQEETPALLIWGQSWDAEGWEASVAFLKKWGWLARGSPELLKATNQWRTARGEKPLAFPAE